MSGLSQDVTLDPNKQQLEVTKKQLDPGQLNGQKIPATLEAAILMAVLEGLESQLQNVESQEMIKFQAALPVILKYKVIKEGDKTIIELVTASNHGKEITSETITVQPGHISINESINGITPKGKPIALSIKETIDTEQYGCGWWFWGWNQEDTQINVQVNGVIGNDVIDETESIDIDQTNCGWGWWNEGWQDTNITEHFSGTVTQYNPDGTVTQINIREDLSAWLGSNGYDSWSEENSHTYVSEYLGDRNFGFPQFFSSSTFSENICDRYGYRQSGLSLKDILSYILLSSPIAQSLGSLDPADFGAVNPLALGAALFNTCYKEEGEGYDYFWDYPRLDFDSSKAAQTVLNQALAPAEKVLEHYGKIEQTLEKEIEEVKKLLLKMLEEILKKDTNDKSDSSSAPAAAVAVK